jgi:prevent-host-death family protein
MSVVPAAEVQKNFGQYREAALGEPVIVTSYGKPSVVILSIAEYERLKELDRRVLRLDEMSDAQIEEMTRAEIPPELRYSIDDIPDRD